CASARAKVESLWYGLSACGSADALEAASAIDNAVQTSTRDPKRAQNCTNLLARSVTDSLTRLAMSYSNACARLATRSEQSSAPRLPMEDKASMSATDKRKQSLYFPESMLQEIQKEAARLDRSLSWIVQRCVKIGLSDIRKLPSVNDIADGARDDNDE